MLFSTLALFAASLLGSALAKPEQIRGVRDPIYHLYLQAHPTNASLAVLGPEATSERFDIPTTIRSVNTTMYLNVGTESTSYKSLTFGTTASTDSWGLEGDTIMTKPGSALGRNLNFVVCRLEGSFWRLWLQTGSDMPSGNSCSNYQTIHLPCLC
ncbi:hypothetical protein MGG_15084 [Pyricularia oryzae 70-15]|uniref:Uncharacterized protein n=1 Tax=Pyricularia oryzae (strain 70-15 / ATCC MYA-4617 / FGSC 8958) TaxID=242507 RepID=G4MUI2_PYRO7|nr:uncharacterized protein MGG_15084 [Pyricularia oryzae 70-15]EHA55675.1 hypothetical protein MGG_15084 [Pyricularia oryzae 70-15]KAI7914349.1 hypothetical protein M9X92_009042 [Pyricularia oryzae]KAI7932271.1 hypothetical protein M0657_000710 [Pyricularia oryzae]